MSSLYDIAGRFAELFDLFDAINDFEPDTNADGEPIDYDGEVITDLDAFKADMLSMWFDTLEGIEGEFNEKAENIACYIKNLEREAEMHELEAKEQASRAKVKRKKADLLRKRLIESMSELKIKKVDMPKALISFSEGRESVVIDDEKALIDYAEAFDESLLKYEQPTIRKSEIKKRLIGGSSIPAAHLEKKPYITIK